MQKRWILRQVDEGVVTRLCDELGVPPLLARVLAQRDLIAPEDAARFLSCSLRSDLPSPFLMADMDRAVERLVRALRAGELICVWGDYDVDGTTGAAALISFLREVGGDPMPHVPHRIQEGYGLNSEALESLGRRGVKLVVSIDCGISNVAEVESARASGVDVVIVDHHEPPPVLPRACAILNPHRVDCPFPDKGLSGAGLAFYLIVGLRAKLRELGWFKDVATPDVRRYLDIVTLGTIADMVPLRGVNRVLARRGLMELGASERPGILALKRVAGIPPGEVGVGHIAFQLGPRINAAGRMDGGRKVVEMLTAGSIEDAGHIAQELDRHNRERQALEARVLEEALAQLRAESGIPETDGLSSPHRYSIVLGAEGWHPGVVGIVASRIVERFYRPTVVVAFQQGEGKGSARSIRDFHLVEALGRCADLLEKFGGHKYAGGLSIKRERFRSFAERFEEVARTSLSSEDLTPSLEVDARLDFSGIGLPVTQQIDRLAPFGIGNPEPLFLSEAVEVAERRNFNGVSRFRLRQGGRMLNAVAFGLQAGDSNGGHRGKRQSGSETLDSILRPGAKIDLVYRLCESKWNGTCSVELRVMDARLAGNPGWSPTRRGDVV